MHFHMVGHGKDIDRVDEDVYFHPDNNWHPVTSVVYPWVNKYLVDVQKAHGMEPDLSTGGYVELCYRILLTSQSIDSIVLLAMDAVFDPETGQRNDLKTDLWVPNRYLSRTVKTLNHRLRNDPDPRAKTKRFFYGGSVSPNRTGKGTKDRSWEEELQFVIDDPDAVLVKMIPSVQHIHLEDQRHKPYYRRLAESGLPLLCHVGPEHSFPEGLRNPELDDFRRLALPLENEVTVIAAHCSTPVFPVIEKNEMKVFRAFMNHFNDGGRVRLYGDTSAFSLSTRALLLKEIRDTFPAEWLLHGTDFPIPIERRGLLPKEIKALYSDGSPCSMNPLDIDVEIKRKAGFPDSILTNAERVLRLFSDRA